MLTLGLAEQYRDAGVTANCLWPATLIATAAVENVVAQGDELRYSRRPEIMADATAVLLIRDVADDTGNCYLDEDVLRTAGQNDLSRYAAVAESRLARDLFV